MNDTKKDARATSNRYARLVVSPAKTKDEGYKRFFGGGAAKWTQRGAFQLELMKQFGLRPEHRFADYGCGPIRGGEHFIRYLEAERYHGYDFKPEFIAIARDIVERDSDLASKKPELTTPAGFLEIEHDHDYMLFYSVLNHCGAAEQLRTLDLARALGPRTRIVMTHAGWFDALDPQRRTGIVARSLPDDILERLGAEHLGWRRAGSIRNLLPIYEIHGAAL